MKVKLLKEVRRKYQIEEMELDGKIYHRIISNSLFGSKQLTSWSLTSVYWMNHKLRSFILTYCRSKLNRD